MNDFEFEYGTLSQVAKIKRNGLWSRIEYTQCYLVLSFQGAIWQGHFILAF